MTDDHIAEVARLQEKIRTLADEQVESLRRATYVGMTPAEAKMYDARRISVTRLIKQLGEIQNAQ